MKVAKIQLVWSSD